MLLGVGGWGAFHLRHAYMFKWKWKQTHLPMCHECWWWEAGHGCRIWKKKAAKLKSSPRLHSNSRVFFFSVCKHLSFQEVNRRKIYINTLSHLKIDLYAVPGTHKPSYLWLILTALIQLYSAREGRKLADGMSCIAWNSLFSCILLGTNYEGWRLCDCMRPSARAFAVTLQCILGDGSSGLF